MNYYRFSDLTISMTCRYDIMKRRAEKYLIPKAKENELSETTTPEIRLNPKNELIQKYQEKYPHLTLDEAELILLSSHFSLELIKHQGLFSTLPQPPTTIKQSFFRRFRASASQRIPACGRIISGKIMYILLMMTSLLFASLEIHLPYTERHLAETAMKMKT